MRVAFVTGAARGIGAATVDELCRQGYCVGAFDICGGSDSAPALNYPLATRSDLEEVASRWPDQVRPFVGDVRDRAALGAAVIATVEAFGPLDSVVAAAGVVAGGNEQWTTPDPVFDALMDVNVRGVWNTAAATIPLLLQHSDPSGCRFVAVASAAGERGLFHLTGYSVSKHAVIGMVRGLAADLTGTGLSVIAVSPGSTRTTMLTATAGLYGSTPEELATHQGIRRLIEPTEIASVIATCCSAAGAVLNGSVVNADGGFTG